MRPEQLPVDPLNAKGHASSVISRSISELGFIEPIVVDERTGQIVSGHGRREELIELEQQGAALPDGIVVDDDGRWLAPVVLGWRSRDDDHAKATGIVLNRAGELGGWRADQLTLRLQELDAAGVSLELVGYSTGQLDDLLATLGPVPSRQQLADTHGEPRPEDFWPQLRLALPPALKARYDALVETVDGDDVARFTSVVDRAEQAPKRRRRAS